LSDETVRTLREAVADRLRALPGVTAVAQVAKVPLSPGRTQAGFRRPGDAEADEFDVNVVSPEFFAVLGLPIVSGRAFVPADRHPQARAVVVTEATARRLWPGRDAVGQTMVPGSDPQSVLEVVGVARDAQMSHVPGTASRYLYLPAGASAERRLTLLIRSGVAFESLAPGIRAAVRGVDGALLPRVQPLDAALDYWRRNARAMAILSASLGLVALLLALAGVHGVVAYIVHCRRREVGIRMALGAAPGAVQAVFLRQMAGPVVIGVVGGASGAAAASRVLESRLYGVSPIDPIAFGAAALFVIATAAGATLLPTRRALASGPAAVLKDG
jgi:putative ABC transport system permease protein